MLQCKIMTKMITSGQIICTLKTQQYLFIVPPCEFYFGRNKDKQNNIGQEKTKTKQKTSCLYKHVPNKDDLSTQNTVPIHRNRQQPTIRQQNTNSLGTPRETYKFWSSCGHLCPTD